MFLLNSCLGLFSAALFYWAPLLPKLRGHFAEFLNNASPVGLRILSSSTCVGLRYGYLYTIAAFLDSGSASLLSFSLRITPLFRWRFSSRLSFAWTGFSLPRLMLSFCVPTVLLYGSTGISTCCPSATPFGLALGPDLPRADQLYPGNLGYSAGRIPTFFLATHSGILSSIPSTAPSGTRFFILTECSSTNTSLCIPKLRWYVLAPDIFGAGPLD